MVVEVVMSPHTLPPSPLRTDWLDWVPAWSRRTHSGELETWPASLSHYRLILLNQQNTGRNPIRLITINNLYSTPSHLSISHSSLPFYQRYFHWLRMIVCYYEGKLPSGREGISSDQFWDNFCMEKTDLYSEVLARKWVRWLKIISAWSLFVWSSPDLQTKIHRETLSQSAACQSSLPTYSSNIFLSRVSASHCSKSFRRQLK